MCRLIKRLITLNGIIYIKRSLKMKIFLKIQEKQ